jgi:homocysteine S-methyltransferase
MGALPFLIKDGGLSTEIESNGHSLEGALWSARLLRDNPDAIAAVHRSFLEAGADCILTASYQATVAGFMAQGLSRSEAQGLIALAVEIARHERESFLKTRASRNRPAPLVGGSAGSYGAFLADGSEYRGGFALSREELADFHRERAALLLDAGADFLAFETIPCLEEGLAIAAMLRNDFPQAQSWIVFSARDNARLYDGTPFADVVAALEDYPGVQAVGDQLLGS